MKTEPFAERAFSYAGPSAWNGLFEDMRGVADPVEFRKQVKTDFFTATLQSALVDFKFYVL